MSDHPKSRLPSPIKRRIAVAVTLAAGALASLNSATAATECGAPRYDRATERALFIWKDCTGTGAWQVRVTAGGQPSSVLFEGSVISDRRFGAVTGIRLEATDVRVKL